MFVWSSDSLMRRILESNIAENLKERLLPIKNSAHRNILDSKVGQIQFFEACGVEYPRSIVLERKDYLKTELILGVPVFIKSDRGSGGDASKRTNQM